MILKDDRTEEQKITHRWLVIATDSFMSGWGEARGGRSYAAWACTERNYHYWFSKISARPEMKRVRLLYEEKPYKPKIKGTCHIYIGS